jgi:PAS domain-containing protein
MDNNQAVDRRRTVQASQSPMATLEQLPALVSLERIPIPTLAVLRDGTIVFANGAFAEMVGRDADEVVSLRFHDVFYRHRQRNRCSRLWMDWRTWSSN